MGTTNKTLTNDIIATDTYTDVASMDQTSDDTASITSSNNNTASTGTANSFIVLSIGYTDVASMDDEIDTSFTSLADSYSTSVSLLINQNLDTLEETATIIGMGKPFIFSDRDDELPIVFYSRIDAKPVIFSNGEYGIERGIVQYARIRSYMHQIVPKNEIENEEHTSSNEFDSIASMDQTQDDTETGCTSSWSHSVA